jgi:indole-3-glycerol phosphate synthase
VTRFLQALLDARAPVIAEIKRQGPYGEDLFRGRPLADIVGGYLDAGAPCLSVVTGRWFGGDAGLLGEVARLSRLPILQKDFITTERQIAEARSLGASAVLLTGRVLPRQGLQRLAEISLRHGLTPFVEVVSEGEIDAVARGPACVVAVNNKDISHRERNGADLERSLSLLSATLGTGTRCPVSASGIDCPAAAVRLLAAGFKGLLVGTALLLSNDPGEWFAELDRRLHAVGSG